MCIYSLVFSYYKGAPISRMFDLQLVTPSPSGPSSGLSTAMACFSDLKSTSISPHNTTFHQGFRLGGTESPNRALWRNYSPPSSK